MIGACGDDDKNLFRMQAGDTVGEALGPAAEGEGSAFLTFRVHKRVGLDHFQD